MKKNELSYNSKLVDFARQNRKTMTKGETILWSYLKGKNIDGVKFRRQKPIENFIPDFFSMELNLAIEVQGYSHTLPEVIEKDKKKFKRLNQLGIHVLEIDNQEIFNDIDNVIATIQQAIQMLRKKS